MRSEPRHEPPSDIVALVMAAGVSRRFGRDKRQVRLKDGRTLLETTLETISQVYSRCCLVTRSDDPDDLARQALPMFGELRRVAALNAADGLGGSLGDAFRHLLAQDDKAIAAAVVLGDMPWLRSTTCVRLNQHALPERIVMPRHRGRYGHPVLFGRDFWPALAELKGGEGARGVVQANKHVLDWIDVEDDGIWRDVDTPRDLPDSK